MSNTPTTLILEPKIVNGMISEENILIVDLCQADTYITAHIPGAVFLDYNWIVTGQKPRMGLLPEIHQLARILTAYGIDSDTHVIAYDDEGGGRACRFLWTLQTIGHQRLSLINGGIQAWTAEGLEMDQQIHFPQPLTQTREINYSNELIADKGYIKQKLNDSNTVILDARSAPEFNGIKVFAARGGHIPGAVHYEWTNAMDKNNNLKLKDNSQLLNDLAELGITPDKNIICHCQSHHRSAHTCIVLNYLGFKNVQGYPGSWSDWGNDPDTPID